MNREVTYISMPFFEFFKKSNPHAGFESLVFFSREIGTKKPYFLGLTLEPNYSEKQLDGYKYTPEKVVKLKNPIPIKRGQIIWGMYSSKTEILMVIAEKNASYEDIIKLWETEGIKPDDYELIE